MEDILRIHSFQSLGTVDGPGVRAVVFLQGCPLRCACCHNPDTWDYDGGTQISIDELVDKIHRCKAYFGEKGGVTASGGEPLLQAKALSILFDRLHKLGINTALDTSGCVLNTDAQNLLSKTDLVLLDYKYTNEEDYLKYTGLEKRKVDAFLEYLEKNNITTVLRYVLIPGLNNDDASIKRLFDLRKSFSCIKSIEILPFRKLCIEKYDAMGIEFPLRNTEEASQSEVNAIYFRYV